MIIKKLTELGLNPTSLNGQIRIKCPFRENHTSWGEGAGAKSMFLTPDINAYHCFSCKEKGSLLKLFLHKLDLPFEEAIEYVSITLRHEKEKKPYELDEIIDFSRPPKTFLDRGICEETLKHFKIGSSINERGLEVITIPYIMGGVLRGLTKRTYLKGGNKNIVSSKGFNKQEFLYNYNPSWEEVVLVEGETDAMRLYQLGVKNVFAILGSNISEWHIKTLSKFKVVYCAFDNDWAGYTLNEIANKGLSTSTKVRFVPYLRDDPEKIETRREWLRGFYNSMDYLEYSYSMSIAYGAKYLGFKKRFLI